MTDSAALSVLTTEPGLARYMKEIGRVPMLEPREEYMLAKRWREQGDRTAAHRLVTTLNTPVRKGRCRRMAGLAARRYAEPRAGNDSKREFRQQPCCAARFPLGSQQPRTPHLRGAPDRREGGPVR